MGNFVIRNSNEIRKLLQSKEMQKLLFKVADEIKDEVKEKATNAGHDYKYEVEVEVNPGRAVATILTKDEKAKYSEAKHGWLSAAAHKHRGIIS